MSAQKEPIASPLHTGLLLLALMILDAATVVIRVRRGTPDFVGPAGRLPLYAEIVALQLLLLTVVWTSIRRSGHSLRELIDDAPWTAARWLRYAGVALGGWVVWMIFSTALTQVLHPEPAELHSLMEFLPKNAMERLCWTGFALVTTVCEEVIYRGYFLKQFRAITRSGAMAIVLQAAVYGGGHVALGTALLVSVTLLGLWLGILTAWQKSVVPAMIVHAAMGLLGGVAPPQ